MEEVLESTGKVLVPSVGGCECVPGTMGAWDQSRVPGSGVGFTGEEEEKGSIASRVPGSERRAAPRCASELGVARLPGDQGA